MDLIDREKLVNKWERLLKIMIPDEDGKHSVSLEKVIEKLKEAPTVDAVEVVRCKDCCYKRPYMGLCVCKITNTTKKPDGFCDKGHRDGD